MPIETINPNPNCYWIDIEAPKKTDLDNIATQYKINHLMLDDSVDAHHLPKFEENNGVKFFLMRENTHTERTGLNSITDVSTKLSLFILEDKIISIHRMKNVSVSTLKNNINQNPTGWTNEKLTLQLGLLVLKSYNDEAHKLLDLVDKMESDIFLKSENSRNLILKLYRLKRQAGLNMRVLNISDEWVEKFKRLNLPDSELQNLKDRYQHVVTNFDSLNNQITNLISMFLALSDQKANQVMKILAKYSVYFLPITFIAGVYGMNFDNMPELRQTYAYFVVLGIMATIVLVTFIYFQRKKW